MSIGFPIRHVVMIINEHHSFDSYFGTYPGVDGDTALDVSRDGSNGAPHHDHQAWMNRMQHPVRIHFREADIPAYFAYARQFTLCDRYFTEVAGPSTPNHLMLIAAASPTIEEARPDRGGAPMPSYDLPSLPASLEREKYSWGNYGGQAFELITALKGHPATHRSERFAVDAADGVLPTVSWVYAPRPSGGHAPASGNNQPSDPRLAEVTRSMCWTQAQVDAVVGGGNWSDTAIFITWAHWGGWFDHVAPPNVEAWHDDGAHPHWDGTQFRYGSRAACLVLSPYSKRRHTSQVQHSHVSLLRFCETVFGLPALNARDAAADDMADCFDFRQTSALPPAPGEEG